VFEYIFVVCWCSFTLKQNKKRRPGWCFHQPFNGMLLIAFHYIQFVVGEKHQQWRQISTVLFFGTVHYLQNPMRQST
jgi:hypothetical protein